MSLWEQLWIKNVDVLVAPPRSADNSLIPFSEEKKKKRIASSVCHWQYNEDLISIIFAFLGDGKSYQQATVLALVCSEWYAFVRFHSSFWSSLDAAQFSLPRGEIEDSLVEKLVCRYHSMIRNVTIRDCMHLSERSIYGIAANCPNIVSLDIESVGSYLLRDLTACIIEVTRTCKKLLHLNLSWCVNLRDDAIQHIGKYCRKLRSLKLRHNSRLSTTALSSLKQCKALRTLDLRGCRLLRDCTIQAICVATRKLKHLDISGCIRLTDGAIKVVVTCCLHLEVFDFSNIPLITAKSLQLLMPPNQRHPNRSPYFGRKLKLVRFSSSRRLKLTFAKKFKAMRPEIKVIYLQPRNSKIAGKRKAMAIASLHPRISDDEVTRVIKVVKPVKPCFSHKKPKKTRRDIQTQSLIRFMRSTS